LSKFAQKIKSMKKIVLLLGLGIASSLFGQDAFKRKTTVLNLGLGLGNGYVRYWGVGYSSTPYINVALDHGVYDFSEVKGLSIGLGGFLGWRRVSYTYNDIWVDRNGRWHYNEPFTESWSYMNLGFRPTLHYSFEDVKAEVYAGFPIGYTFVNYKVSNPDYYYVGTYANYFSVGFQLGGRYYFTDRFGIFLEFGYTYSYANLGISLKF